MHWRRGTESGCRARRTGVQAGATQRCPPPPNQRQCVAAMSMAVFTLGTFPMLWLVGYLGGWVQRRWSKWARPVLPAIALLNAIVLGGMAWNWIAT